MLKHTFSTRIGSLLCGAIWAIANCVAAQEPIELLAPVGNDVGIEQIAAEAVSEPQVSFEQQDEEGFETLTRGPLHEGFAEPIVADPAPGMIVTKEPPAPVNELPPEYRPDGEDAIWIAGYWGWDDNRDDYIWISGVYRVPPDGHQWVPGYWNQMNEGWQWVQGFWVEDVADSIAYLPPPPATLENGPSSPAPGVNYFYVPGNWSQSNSLATSLAMQQSYASPGYVWNVGYWHPMQDDLVWIPAHVVWTPRGCVFVDGYWDRRLPMRGLCFAPVSIPRATYSRPGWSLRPNVVLNTQVILHNLFVQPRYCHYMFGDYYGLPLTHRHVVPAYVYHQSRGSCDPLISFYSAYNARQGQDMIRWYGNQYADLSRNPSKRPPKTWSPVNLHADHPTGSGRDHPQIAHTLDQVNKLGGGPKISPTTVGLQQEMLKRDLDRKRFAKDREETERKAQPHGPVANVGIVPPTLSLPKLDPIVARKVDLAGKKDTEPRKNKMPEKPRSSNRPVDGIPREGNPGQAARRVESIPKNVEPTQPNTTPRLPKIENRMPRIESRQPNIENRMPNIEPRIPNIEPRQPNIRLPQPNRNQPPNDDRQKNNRGNGPIGGLLDQPRNNAPAQPVVPRLSSPPKVKGNNTSSTRSLPQVDRQPRTGSTQSNPQSNPQSNGRRNADKGDGGKRPK